MWPSNDAFFDELFHPFIPANLSIGFCQVTSSSGVWKTQRVGPLVSSGGFDWRSLSWRNALDLTGYNDIMAHWTGPVDVDGIPLPYPPVHVHGVHVVPCRKMSVCPGNGLLRIIEHHGDLQFLEEAGGVDSFGLYYAGAGKRCEEIGISWMMNDARASSSPPLNWYVQFSALISAQAKRPLLSLFKFHGPAELFYYHSLGSLRVPVTTETFITFHHIFGHAGHLVNAVAHAHPLAYQGTLLLAATPERLSLVSPYHFGKLSVLVPNKSGRSNKEDLRSLELAMSYERILMCSARGHLEMVDGAGPYDRSVEPSCKQRYFPAFTSFTAIWFYGPEDHVRYASMTMREHANWFLTYESDDGRSHYDAFVFSIDSMGRNHSPIIQSVSVPPARQLDSVRLLSIHNMLVFMPCTALVLWAVAMSFTTGAFLVL